MSTYDENLLRTAKKSNVHKPATCRPSWTDTAKAPLSAANTNVQMATNKLSQSETVHKTRAVLKVATDHVGEVVDKEKATIIRAANTDVVGPVVRQIAQSETMQKTKETIGPAVKCVTDAAMMPLSAANETVIAPLAKTETVKKTREVLVKTAETFDDDILPAVKRGTKSAKKAIRKTAEHVGETFDEDIIPAVKRGTKSAAQAMAWTAEHVGETFDEDILPAVKRGTKSATKAIRKTAEHVDEMIVRAFSYDEQDDNEMNREAPIANTQMVSYAIASCKMRKAILREEEREARRAAKVAKMLQGKRTSSADENECVVLNEQASNKKVRTVNKAPVLAVPKAATVDKKVTEPADVFVPRIIEEAPASAADLYAPPPRILQYRQPSISDLSCVSDLTFGTAGCGKVAPSLLDIPLVVARSVDEDDATVDRWEV